MAAPWANAEITISSYGGYSQVKLPDTSTGSTGNGYTFYAGFAGTCAAGDMNNGSTCNSCRGSAGTQVSGVYLTACNPQNAYGNLRFHLDLVTSNSSLAGGTISAEIKDTTVTISNTPPAISAGTVIPVEFTWDSICQAATGSSCTSASDFGDTLSVTFKNGSATETVEVSIVVRVVDASDTTIQFSTVCDDTTDSPLGGACNVGFLKGDEKAYIDTNLFFVAADYPSTGSTAKFNNVVFLYESGDANATADSIFSTITNASSMKDIATDTSLTPPISDNRIDSLTNGTQYCFVMANKDQTGIISRFTPVSFSTATGTTKSGAEMCMIPEKVAGLLDGKSCFIATAAFGSDMAPEVETFRQFRNKYLLSSELGKDFVRTYYKYSPKYAAIIQQSDILRAGVRAVLWPMLAVVKLSLMWGAWAALAVVGLVVSLITWGGLSLRRKRETA